VAAILSFVFPGLGHAYLGRRGAALAFALPVGALVLGLVGYFVASGSITRAGLKLLDPTVATFAALMSGLLALWWSLAIVSAARAGRPDSSALRLVPIGLVLVIAGASIAPAVPLGASWFWQLSVADRGFFVGDPTQVNTTPSPSGAATQPPQSGSPGPSPTRGPDYVDPSDEPSDEPSPSIAAGPTPSFDITKIDAHDDGFLNVLLAGTDQGIPGHLGGRSDTIVVVSVNSTTGEVLMFSFPRDLQNFPIFNGGTYNGKINTFANVTRLPQYKDEFPDPGLPSLAYEVGYLLGIPIDYYASVNAPGFMDVVRAVGGTVTVCNERQISDNTLQFYLSPGIQVLGPEDALRYARSRHGQTGGDFARARRQQQLLVALKKEIMRPENLARLPELVQALSSVIKTNFPPDQLSSLIDLADSIPEDPSQTWVFKNPEWADLYTRAETGGRQVLTPRLDRIGALSIQLFGEKSLYYGQIPTPSPTPDSTPTPEPSASPDVCAAQ
jgi:LCP family protein required for cell wall assembly